MNNNKIYLLLGLLLISGFAAYLILRKKPGSDTGLTDAELAQLGGLGSGSNDILKSYNESALQKIAQGAGLANAGLKLASGIAATVSALGTTLGVTPAAAATVAASLAPSAGSIATGIGTAAASAGAPAASVVAATSAAESAAAGALSTGAGAAEATTVAAEAAGPFLGIGVVPAVLAAAALTYIVIKAIDQWTPKIQSFAFTGDINADLSLLDYVERNQTDNVNTGPDVVRQMRQKFNYFYPDTVDINDGSLNADQIAYYSKYGAVLDPDQTPRIQDSAGYYRSTKPQSIGTFTETVNTNAEGGATQGNDIGQSELIAQPN